MIPLCTKFHSIRSKVFHKVFRMIDSFQIQIKKNVSNKTKNILELWEITVTDTIPFNGSQNLALNFFLLGLKFSIDWLRLQIHMKKNSRKKTRTCLNIKNKLIFLEKYKFKCYKKPHTTQSGHAKKNHKICNFQTVLFQKLSHPLSWMVWVGMRFINSPSLRTCSSYKMHGTLSYNGF